MTDFKLLPYGLSDFRQIVQEGKYMVDKSMYIEKMERAGNFLFLIRPRRFGKSIFLSMLRYYYDINLKDGFKQLFKELFVGDHPTAEQGKYQVLYLDFSQISGNFEKLYDNFSKYLSLKLQDFAEYYASYYPDNYLSHFKEQETADAKLSFITTTARTHNCSLYLIVDEYDNFTNSVLNEQGEAVYHALTHATGFYRDVFKKFKGNFDRILMMGVSPVTMDDVTSGYNIALNLTMDARFNMMLGFSETDVRQMIRYYQSVGALQADEEALIAEMKPWYDGYCFSLDGIDSDPRMFNCDMVTYYLIHYIEHGRPPKEMVDVNTRTDYTKLDKLIQLDSLDNDRKSVLLEVAQNGSIVGDVVSSFPAAHLTDPEMFRSLLFYYGMLTFVSTDGFDTVLGIPNLNVRTQYYDYLLKEYNQILRVDTTALSRCYKQAALYGDGLGMMRHICKAYYDTTSVRSLIQGERNLQGFMNAYLTLNPCYYIAPEVELNHGYSDFFLLPNLQRFPSVKHSYIIELKYLSKGDTTEKASTQWQEAVAQIQGYAQGERVKAMAQGTQLHLIVVQMQGYELGRIEEIPLP
jgi:hypothetical protein